MARISAGDPMQLTITPGAAPGADIPLRIVVRNAGFQPHSAMPASMFV